MNLLSKRSGFRILIRPGLDAIRLHHHEMVTMTQQNSDAALSWFARVPTPVQYFLVFGAFVGGGALLLVGVMGLTSPPEDAGLMHWLSSIGFVAVLGPLVLWGAVRLLRQTRGDTT